MPASSALAYEGQDVALDTSSPLRVVITEEWPFVVKKGSGYGGFSIEIWEQVADRLGVESDYQVVATVDDQIAALVNGNADVAIGSVVASTEVAKQIALSIPYLDGGLRTLVKNPGAEMNPVAFLKSVRVWAFVGVLIAATLLFAHFRYWNRRRGAKARLKKARRQSDSHADEMADAHDVVDRSTYRRSIAADSWDAFAANTSPGSVPNRAHSATTFGITILWLVFSLLLINEIRATLVTEATVDKFAAPDERIVTVEDSKAQKHLEEAGIAFEVVPDFDTAIEYVEGARAASFVYGSPYLAAYAHGQGDEAELLMPHWTQEFYTIGLVKSGPLFRPVNRALISIFSSGEWQTTFDAYFVP